MPSIVLWHDYKYQIAVALFGSEMWQFIVVVAASRRTDTDQSW